MSGSPKWFEVLCDRHGTQDAGVKAYKHKAVSVGRPKHRRDRKSSGCPLCAAEAKLKLNS